MRSTNKRIVTALSSVAMAAACLGFVSDAQADVQTQSATCSLATLKGAYGVKLDGVVQAQGNPERKLDVVATMTFDGAGNFDANFVGRINGDPIAATISKNPYSVNATCIGKLELTQAFRGFTNVSATFVIVERGKELFIVVDGTTSPVPVVVQVSGEAERLGGGDRDR